MLKNLVCIITISILFTSQSKALTSINFRWDYVVNEVSPLMQRHRSTSTSALDLDGSTISFFSGPNHTFKTTGKIGDALEAIGSDGTSVVHSYSYYKNKIVDKETWPGYLETSVIQIDGNSCSVNTTYRRLPGQRYFIGRRVSNHETMYISDMHAENEVCQMRNIPSR